MKKMVLAAVAASMLTAPMMAAPAFAKHGHRDAYSAGYRDGYQRSRAYNDSYCRRDSSAEGTVLGAIGGGALGQVLGKRGDKTLSTVVGVGLGGLIGREIDKSEGRCR